MIIIYQFSLRWDIMNLNDIKSRLTNFNKSSNLSKETYAFGDFIDILQKTSNDMIPMIINGEGIWLFSLIVPKDKLIDGCIDKLLKWDIHAAHYGYYGDYTNKYFLSKPCESCMPKDILEDAIPVFYQREMFAGKKFDVELNQQISHVLELAKLDEPNSYYKLEKGDFVKVVEGDDEVISLHVLRQEELDKFLSISNSVLIRFFESSISGKDVALNPIDKTVKNEDENIYYNYYQNTDYNYSIKLIKGFQMIHCEKEYDEFEKETDFETFLVKDFESSELIEHTCNPSKISNMFVENDYPRDLSMVFFDKEVMYKYENDSEKYTIRDRSIECRDYWYLRYSMSDDKSQVIVYLCDLSKLPYEEQNHWKRFNEEPKSKLPNHVIKNDLNGEWHDCIDPLKMLRTTLREFPKCKFSGTEVELWVEKNKGSIRSLDNLKYLKYGTKDEWETKIDNACQIFVEGLNKSALNTLAKHFGCSVGGSKSINNLRACLEAIKIGGVIVDAIVNPLEELDAYRNDVDHARDVVKYPSDLPEELIEIYNNLIRRLLYSFECLSKIIRERKFDF